jgi:mRNA interferase YafQ
MLQVEYTTQFKRDLKLSQRRRKNLELLHKIMTLIENEEPLGIKLKDHTLSGNWAGHRELHIEPDWLLIYKIVPRKKTVIFVRLGTHSDLFKKNGTKFS